MPNTNHSEGFNASNQTHSNNTSCCGGCCKSSSSGNKSCNGICGSAGCHCKSSQNIKK